MAQKGATRALWAAAERVQCTGQAQCAASCGSWVMQTSSRASDSMILPQLIEHKRSFRKYIFPSNRLANSPKGLTSLGWLYQVCDMSSVPTNTGIPGTAPRFDIPESVHTLIIYCHGPGIALSLCWRHKIEWDRRASWNGLIRTDVNPHCCIAFSSL